MRVFIAEKPDLAKAIVNGIGGHFEKKDGYFESTNDIVTWCYGHLLELKKPEEFDPSYKAWTMESLPLKLYPVQLQPKEASKKQTKTVLDLIKNADEIVHAGDPDDEGQLLVDELLIYANNKKPVKRLLINDLEHNAVKESLKNMRPNSDFQGLYKKALARSVADAIYGMSLTRACTIKAGNQKGSVFSVGRVQTPVLGLIIKRYLESKSHQKSFYYVLKAKFGDNEFDASYLIKDDAPTDDKKRIINKDYLKEIQTKIIGKYGSITNINRESKETIAPLPYNLAKLQQDMSKKYGYTATKTLEITQELREKYQAITYNRSDCSYLSSEQFEKSPRILKNIIVYFGKNLSFNENQKTRAFDDSKITAHTAIIPTEKTVNIDLFNEEQKNVYRAICERFLIQFLPTKKYDVITVTVSIENETFILKSQNITDNGFTTLLTDVKEENEENEENEVLSNFFELEKMTKNDSLICSTANIEANETKPKPLFTEASLLSAMVRVADFVEDPKIRELLKAKDKDKKDEHGGIGTPATRHTFTEILKKRGFIELNGKNLVPTKVGIDYYNSLPKKILLPDLTALMFEQQERIEKNELSVDDFINNIYLDIEAILNEIKMNNFEIENTNALDYKCPFCDGDLDSLPKSIKCMKGCGLIVWREIAGKRLTDNQMRDLITKRCTSEIKGFKSRAGSNFDAKLKLNDDKKVNFEFKKK